VGYSLAVSDVVARERVHGENEPSAAEASGLKDAHEAAAGLAESWNVWGLPAVVVGTGLLCAGAGVVVGELVFADEPPGTAR
jgi:hypothetical protein